MQWRPLTLDDVPALTRAYAAVEAADGTGEHFSEPDVRDVLEDEAVDLSRDSLAAVGDGGEILAWARVQGSPRQSEGGVVPSVRRQGLGRRLLDWAQERGAVQIEVHEGNPGKEALARAAGYEPIRWWYTMQRDLDGSLPEIPPVPDGLALAPYARERDADVRRAHAEAFADHWGFVKPDERRWARWYTGMPAFRPDVSHLVLDGDEIAGFLNTYFWEADAAGTGVREAFVGQVGVRPAWRRRGLGALLLATALHSYRAAGFERSVLSVDTGNVTSPLGLYERAGYAVRATFVTWAKPG